MSLNAKKSQTKFFLTLNLSPPTLLRIHSLAFYLCMIIKEKYPRPSVAEQLLKKKNKLEEGDSVEVIVRE